MKKISKLFLVITFVFIINLLFVNHLYAETIAEEVFVETVSNVNSSENYVTHESTVTDEMATSDYWANKLGQDADKLLLSLDEIATINQEIVEGSGTGVYDLTTLVESKTQADRKKSLANSIQSDFDYMVRNYPNKDRKLYVDGELIDNIPYIENMKNAVLNTGFEDNNAKTQLYAVGTRRTEIRTYPTNQVWGYDTPTDPDDESVNSALEVNEPFLIRGKCTINQETFYWGLSYNCSGWVNAEHLAIFDSKEEWIESWKVDRKGKDFIVVTQDCITLEPSINQQTSNVQLKIGTILKLVPSSQIPEKVDDRSIWNNYIVYIPTRDADGKYVRSYALISENHSVNVGFLPLTQREILNVAFSCLGNRYGWGGMIGAMDCTLYTKSIYRCFGLDLPRNTTTQQKVPNKIHSLSGMTDEQKQTLIQQLPIGSVLFFSGHAMVYIGTENGVGYVISDTGSLSDSTGDVNVRSMYSVIVNPLTARRRNGTTWLSSLSSALAFTEVIDSENILVTVDKQENKNHIIYPEAVTKQMSVASYWKDLLDEKNQILADSTKINALNQNLNEETTQDSKNFLVITQDRIILEPSVLDPEISEIELLLGTALELVPENQIPTNLAERGPWHNYVVYLPITKKDGSIERKMALIPEHYHVNIGYLDFTPENILDITLRCLGDSYQLMNHADFIYRVYQCFGLNFHVNQTYENLIPNNIIDFSKMTLAEKENEIKQLPVGSILVMPEQTLIYIGNKDNTIYTIGSIATENGKEVNSIMIGTLGLKSIDGKSWLENVTAAVDFTKDINIFPDVSNGKWYTNSIKYVNLAGIMTGYKDGTFGLNDSITRGQIVTMLYRLAGSPETMGLENPFEDVLEEKYYTEAIKWAFSLGITTGKTETIFDPNGPVTRQELAVFMARYANKLLKIDITSAYDIMEIADYKDLSTWAIAPMQYIMEKGVITGDMKLGYARILPKNNATRAEAATMFARFCQNIVEGDADV